MNTPLPSQLIDIGLSERQAYVYTTLLRLGEVRIGVLSEKLQLHKQSTYNALEELQEKQLIINVLKDGRQYFSAADPSVFLEQNKQQHTLLETLVPQLQLMSGQEQYISDIQIYSGVSAFHRFHEQQLKRMTDESTMDVLGAGGDDFLAIMRHRHFFRNYENLRIHKKIHHRLLMYANQKNVDKAYIERKYVEARFLPQALTQPPMATQIWPDSVSLVLFGIDPQIIHIKSHTIRNGFTAYFTALWESAAKR